MLLENNYLLQICNKTNDFKFDFSEFCWEWANVVVFVIVVVSLS